MAINFPNRNQVTKLKKLNDGGAEAEIYEYDAKYALKLFRDKVDIGKKEAKVKYFIGLMATKLPPCVIGPEEEVTIRQKFAAYLMRKLTANENLHMLSKQKYLVSSGLSNKDVLEIMVNFGKELGKLHKLGIIVGDISDYNFQIVGKSGYFIDVDSWGVDGKFSPDAYTELFTCPESYQANGQIKFSEELENYNFAVLAFNMITGIHPFGGTYLPDKNMSITERMKQKISVLGRHKGDIKVPKAISGFKWISPQLEDAFVKIFEQGKKFDITPYLEELLQNMKKCDSHGIYYYSKFSECPLCNENAKIKVTPTVVKAGKVTSGGPKLTCIFDSSECAYILSTNHYLNKSGEIVHFGTGNKFLIKKGTRAHFSADGKTVYSVSDDIIQILDADGKTLSTIERMHKAPYLIRDKIVYYVDKGSNLVKFMVTDKGNMPNYLGKVYNSFIVASEDGKYVFAMSMYPKTAIVKTPDYTFEVEYSGRINEYAVKFDANTGKWLLVYQMSNGRYRTMVFNKNVVEYDDDVIMYNAQTLANIDYFNNMIYDPADGKIVGTNIIKNISKEFECNVVDESSKLKFTGRGFKIYGVNTVYTYE